MSDLPLKGLTINICAEAGPALFTGFIWLAFEILPNAEAKAIGLPENCAPPWSARYSLDLETANWSSVAAIGANIIRNREPTSWLRNEII